MCYRLLIQHYQVQVLKSNKLKYFSKVSIFVRHTKKLYLVTNLKTIKNKQNVHLKYFVTFITYYIY